MSAARCKPALSSEEEWGLARRWQQHGDEKATTTLVERNRGLVFRIASDEFGNCGVPMEDLTQEGFVGLSIAVRKFDPDRKLRLSTYAAYWVRAYMMMYILRTHGPARIGTRKSERTIFFRLASARRRLERLGEDATPESLAAIMGVGAKDVEQMMPRIQRRDVYLDAAAHEGDDRRTSGDHLADDDAASPEDSAIESVDGARARDRVQDAVLRLPPRERLVVRHRLLADPPMTLREVGEIIGISRERVRQIEVVAKKMLRAALVGE